MSNLKVNSINDASGGSTAVLYGVAAPTNSMGFRNRIINGDMLISQRGTTFSSGIGTLTYTLDRWTVAAAGAAVSVSAAQDASSPYTPYMSITGASGNTLVGIRQRIEWLNTRDLAGQNVTVSFYCYNATSNATSATVQLDFPTAKDNYTSTTSTATQTITLSNTGVQTFTFAVPSAGANGIQLTVYVSNLTSGVFVFRQVQLEAGSVASPFERIDYGRQLIQCQRYLPAFLGGSNAFFGSALNSTQQYVSVNFPVQVRTAPTGLFISSASHFTVGDYISSAGPCTSMSLSIAGLNNASIIANVTSPTVLTQARPGNMSANSASAILYFTGCEL